MSNKIIELTAEIVAAHVSHNSLTSNDIPALVQATFDALSGLARGTTVAPQREPAVSIRSSVKPDHIVCLECGANNKVMKRHLATHHDLTPVQYRERWNLKSDYPMVAPNYAEKRKELALQAGLGRKKEVPVEAPKKARKPRTKKVVKAPRAEAA